MSTTHPPSDAARRTLTLAVALTLAALVGLVALDLDHAPSAGWVLPVWAVALLTLLGTMLVFDVEFRTETYTFTFSELVLVVGLFYATPWSLVVGRLSAEILYLSLRERQPPRKLILNTSVYFAETVVLLGVQQVLRPDLAPSDPWSWLVVLVAVLVAELFGFAMVAVVVRWHGGPITFGRIVRIGLSTAPANASLALVVCVLLDAQPWAVPLLGGVGAALVVLYRAHSRLQQRHDSLSLLYDFTHLVSGARAPDEVLDAMLDEAMGLLRAGSAEFWLADDHGGYQRHVVDAEGARRAATGLPSSLTPFVDGFAAAGGAVLIASGATDPGERAVLETLGASDAMIAPITEGDDLVGFVIVADRLSEIYSFAAADLRMFATLARHAGVALQNGRLIERLHEQARQREHEARHDSLTTLPNRVHFGDRLEERFGDGGGAALLALMDLDGFKEINDTLGHLSGDKVLVEVAARLASAIDDRTTAARLGGDEFALLAGQGTTAEEFETICRDVRTAIARPIEVDGLRVQMGVSIGIAVAPEHADDAVTLLRLADVAMYSAKSGRGGGVCFYDPDLDENTPRRLALAHELRSAVENGELTAVFQPKVSLATGEVLGVEALCRWGHPVLGEIMPDEFVPLADRTGVSTELTTFMLSSALHHGERWQRHGRDWSVAVNVSMRTLLDADLLPIVRGLLAASSLAPDRVVLEITETHVMSDTGFTLRTLRELADLGVRLSVDDFGTGYSSLAYLQRLPVSEVKIDKSFVQAMTADRGADAVVRTVLDLARNLDLHVVAEGVEDAASLERLRELGCVEAQGYHFAPPMPPADVEAYADSLADAAGLAALVELAGGRTPDDAGGMDDLPDEVGRGPRRRRVELAS